VTHDIDIGDLKYSELNALRERIDEKVREMREMGGPALLARFAEEAAELGMTIEEIVQAGGKRRGRPPKPRDEVQG
jgi:hypothetical protein